jgi:hypothetical protein
MAKKKKKKKEEKDNIINILIKLYSKF